MFRNARKILSKIYDSRPSCVLSYTIAAFLFFSLSGSSESFAKEPSIRHKWSTTKLKTKVSTNLQWTSVVEGSLEDEPQKMVIESTLNLRSGHTVVQVSGRRLNAKLAGNSVTFRTNLTKNLARLHEVAPSGEIVFTTLQTTVSFKSLQLLVHESCRKIGIDLKIHKKGVRRQHLVTYAAIHCKGNQITLSYSSEVRGIRSKLKPKKRSLDYTQFKLSNKTPSRLLLLKTAKGSLPLILKTPNRVPASKTKSVVKLKKRATSKLWVYTGLGATSISYKETRNDNRSDQDRSTLTSTATLGISYSLNARWRVGFSSYINIKPLQTSPSDIEFGFMGANLRLGYVVPIFSKPWKFTIMGGTFYTHMMVAEDDETKTFGYNHLIFPQVMPVLSYQVSRSIYSGYLKYVPISKKKLADSGRELGVGASLTYMLRNGHPVSIRMDHSDLDFKYTGDVEYQVKTYSFGITYGW